MKVHPNLFGKIFGIDGAGFLQTGLIAALWQKLIKSIPVSATGGNPIGAALDFLGVI